MTKPGDHSTKMKIKVKTQTGEVDRIKDNSGRDRTLLSKAESDEIVQSSDTEHLGEILYRHSSPG